MPPQASSSPNNPCHPTRNCSNVETTTTQHTTYNVHIDSRPRRLQLCTEPVYPHTQHWKQVQKLQSHSQGRYSPTTSLPLPRPTRELPSPARELPTPARELPTPARELPTQEPPARELPTVNIYAPLARASYALRDTRLHLLTELMTHIDISCRVTSSWYHATCVE